LSLFPVAAMFSRLTLCWAALPLTVAFLPALQLDDECQTGECALEALQLKGGLVEDVDADSSCEDSTGGACMDDVMWAKNEGIRSHPDWYPGLSQGSSLPEFQCQVYKANPAKCPKPCSVSCTGPVAQPNRSPTVVAPSCAGKEQQDACLCVFDIDRTLTSKQGQHDVCPGSSASDGIVDTAYGGGDLVLSALAAARISGTFCEKCYLGICSHGDGSGANSREREELLHQVLRSDAMDKFQMKPQNAAWSDMKLLSPYVVAQPDGRKQDAVAQILEWYASQQVCIPKSNTYFFDDKDANILPFRGTGMNAHQISCDSRDPQLGWGEVGFCGATLPEIRDQKGVTVCKIDCKWSDWSAWGGCSKSCGGGSRQRNRRIIIKTRNGGQDCPGSALDHQECNAEACPTTTTTTTTTTTATESAAAVEATAEADDEEEAS